MAVSGTYGGDGTTYRTEIDQFAKITSMGVGTNGPLKFKVQTKGGIEKRYGYTANSRVEGEGTSVVRTWALNKVKDGYKNQYNLVYIEDSTNGRHYLDSIKYNATVDTPNGGIVGGTEDTVINFVYGNRDDNVTQYEAGSKVQRTPVKLSKIQTEVNGSLVSDYQLVYETVGADSRPRITQIKRCDGAGECQDPISMEWWGDGTVSYTASSMTVPWFNPGTWGYNRQAAKIGYDYNVPRWHDLNGDGKPDYVLPKPTSQGNFTGSNMSFSVKLSTNTGYAANQTWTSTLDGHPKDFHWVDIDGDGKTDIVQLDGDNVNTALAGSSNFISNSAYTTTLSSPGPWPLVL